MFCFIGLEMWWLIDGDVLAQWIGDLVTHLIVDVLTHWIGDGVTH